MKASRIYENVLGAPFHIGAWVEYTGPCDDNPPRAERGEGGPVVYYEYECGCAQSYPNDPMIGVRLGPGRVEEFWAEELLSAKGAPLPMR